MSLRTSLLAVMLPLAVLPAARAVEPPPLRETVEVRVVNVEVVVSDRHGRPVPGLGREDFELRVNGKPVEIEYFRAVAEAIFVDPAAETEDGPGAPSAGGEEPADPEAPYLVIVLDNRNLDPNRLVDALGDLEAELDRLLGATRGIMLARLGRTLSIEQAMTSERHRLAKALDHLRANRLPPVDLSQRTQLMRQIERADSTESRTLITDDPEFNLRVEGQANSLLAEIRAQATSERQQAEASAAQLEALVRSLGGIGGRKAVLYVGAGFHTRPVESAYRLWWSKYRRIAHRLDVKSIEGEISASDVSERVAAVIQAANADRLAFYTHDPGGLQLGAMSAEYGTTEASQALAAESLGRQQTVMSLASGTGGIGQINSNSLAGLLDPMLAGFGTYYSLGFVPPDGGNGRIAVRTPGADYRLRHFDRYATRLRGRRLAERALSALLTGVDENPLGATIEVGEPESQDDGTFLLPLLVKIPLAQLSLLPDTEQHVGRLSVVILARGRNGDLSPPAAGEVPVEIANRDLLAAMSSQIGYRMRMRIAAGEQRIVIGLRDEIAGRDSTVHVALDPTVRRGS